MHNQFSSTHLSGVLRPLSGTSATLSFVHSDVSLQLEKLLHFGTLEPHSQSANESIDEFVQGCIGRLLKDRTAQIQEVASKVDAAQGTHWNHCDTDAIVTEDFSQSQNQNWLDGVFLSCQLFYIRWVDGLHASGPFY